MTLGGNTLLLCAAIAIGACGRAIRSPPSKVPERIARVEQGLLPAVRVQDRSYVASSIAERMRALDVPGASVAVINDGRIEWAQAYGVADVEQHRAATPATLFQAASISKPIAAMAALRLVEEGRLALDEDVNLKLRAWKVPANAWTARQPVTLRLLLSHSAGLTVHGFPGYAAGAPLPTLVQVLNGEQPANTAAVRVDTEPGKIWRYSGGGFSVMQQMLVDVTGQPFPALMRRLALEPLGMTASSYEQPLPAARASTAATGYGAGGRAVPGRYHTYPEMAAAGLWTTPSDLARYILEVQRSFAGTSSRVLSRDMTAKMLTRGVGSHGLGPGIDGQGDSLRFAHGGANEGFRAIMVGFAHRAQGAVVMTNSDQGMLLADEILQAVAREYGWPDFAPRVVVPIAHSRRPARVYRRLFAPRHPGRSERHD